MKKIKLNNLTDRLSRDEMKKIMAGSGSCGICHDGSGMSALCYAPSGTTQCSCNLIGAICNG